MPEIDYDNDAVVSWNRFPTDAAYWEQDEIGFSLRFKPPKILRKTVEPKLSKRLGRPVRLTSVTIKPKHVLKSAAGIAAIAGTAGAGAALTIPSGAGALGMLGADKLLAAAGKGGKVASQAKAIYQRTKALAANGNPQAQSALGILSYVHGLRRKVGVGRGKPLVVKPLSRRARKAITTKVQVRQQASGPQTGYFVSLAGRIRRGKFKPA